LLTKRTTRLLLDHGATLKTTGTTTTELHALAYTEMGPFPPVRVRIVAIFPSTKRSPRCTCAGARVIGREVGQRIARLGQAFGLDQAVANAHGRWRQSPHVHTTHARSHERKLPSLKIITIV
jgi:hypothetical protein